MDPARHHLVARGQRQPASVQQVGVASHSMRLYAATLFTSAVQLLSRESVVPCQLLLRACECSHRCPPCFFFWLSQAMEVQTAWSVTLAPTQREEQATPAHLVQVTLPPWQRVQLQPASALAGQAMERQASACQAVQRQKLTLFVRSALPTPGPLQSLLHLVYQTRSANSAQLTGSALQVLPTSTSVVSRF